MSGFRLIDWFNNGVAKPDLEYTLTLTFSFKNLGSYKSSNLAVSETDKQDIEWESNELDNTLFY